MAIIDNSLLVLHAKNPKYYNLLVDATHAKTHENSSCGDSVTVNFFLENKVIKKVGFSARGCILCKAATSILLEHILGKTVSQVLLLTDDDLLFMLGSPEISYSRRKCSLMGLEAIRSMFVTPHNSKEDVL